MKKINIIIDRLTKEFISDYYNKELITVDNLRFSYRGCFCEFLNGLGTGLYLNRVMVNFRFTNHIPKPDIYVSKLDAIAQ